MNDNFLRKRHCCIIARVDGNTLRGGTGKIVAIYHVTEDVTRDRTGRIVVKGNKMLRALCQAEGRNARRTHSKHYRLVHRNGGGNQLGHLPPELRHEYLCL